MAKRVFLLIPDSFGVGEAPDADAFGDAGSNTLAAVSRSPELFIPNLTGLGLYNIDGATGAPPAASPIGAFARLQERSAGKDTTTGHWELAGILTSTAFPTFPQGFPPEILEALRQATGRDFLCNKAFSGTEVIRVYGREHMETGSPILYTSADSVMQIAAHEQVIPLEELYRICEAARGIMRGGYAVGRIIARPFEGEFPDFARTPNRRDFSVEPPQPTMLDHLKAAGRDVIAVGKIEDIFAGRGVTNAIHTKNNADGMENVIRLAGEDFSGLCFVNLVDFDMLYGHRNDVDGYARALTEFDRALGSFLPLLREDDLLIISADHGCDPSTASTDHSREYVPMLAFGSMVQAGVNLGTRGTFADVAATVLDYLDVDKTCAGTSFLAQIRKAGGRGSC